MFYAQPPKTANQILGERWGVFLQKNKQGKWATFGWSEQNGGGWVECQMSVDAEPFIEAARRELDS